MALLSNSFFPGCYCSVKGRPRTRSNPPASVLRQQAAATLSGPCVLGCFLLGAALDSMLIYMDLFFKNSLLVHLDFEFVAPPLWVPLSISSRLTLQNLPVPGAQCCAVLCRTSASLHSDPSETATHTHFSDLAGVCVFNTLTPYWSDTIICNHLSCELC